MSPGGHERGAGAIATSMGVGVFLMLLLFAVQLTVNLYANSVATDAARTAASWLARQGELATDASARSSASDLARRRLGARGPTFTVDAAVDGPDATVRVRGESPTVLGGVLPSVLPLTVIDTTARVRVEEFRCASPCGTR